MFEIEVCNNNHPIHILSAEIYPVSGFASQYVERYIPTHTEDGIPVRKLYVSNLPAKTTRSELFSVFAPYGFIKSCWLKMGDKGPNQSPTPTYAFVTFSNPKDAHKALLAPFQEKQLRGYNLRISPADSWHQPIEDKDGRVHWKSRGERKETKCCTNESDQNAEESTAGSSCLVKARSKKSKKEADCNSENILNILNQDCMSHILSYLPVIDLIKSERVSKKWRNMVMEYYQSIHTFKTNSWNYGVSRVKLTTAVLRQLLQRLGPSLRNLHLNDCWAALNDRTAHIVGKYCPNLEYLEVVDMDTKNWNPLIYGCKELKELVFVSCNKITDASLLQAIKPGTKIEKLTVGHNSNVTGLFLNTAQQVQLTSLSFYNCYNLQGAVLSSGLDFLPNLTTLKLDLCSVYVWKVIPTILNKLEKLEVLSISECMTWDECFMQISNEFVASFATLKNLKKLSLINNIYISNAVIMQVAQTCYELEYLDISNCNSNLKYVQPGVTDKSVIEICTSCPFLTYLDVSYLAGLKDNGLKAITKLKSLQTLISRGNPYVSTSPFIDIVESCHYLKELDLCGCNNVSEEILTPLLDSVDKHPRKLIVRLASTAASSVIDENIYTENHILLQCNARRNLIYVDFKDDRCNPRFRPDFTCGVYDNSSNDSYGYEHEIYEKMFSSEDELSLFDWTE